MQEITYIKMAGFKSDSIVDGPGLRFAFFVQGCPIKCPGCHNPDFQNYDEGADVSIQKLQMLMDKSPFIRGVTFTGGEPMAQAQSLLPLAERIFNAGRRIWIYSGYTYEQLMEMSKTNDAILPLLKLSDVLVDGPYIQEQRSLELRFRGSKNQRIINLPETFKAGKVIELDFSNEDTDDDIAFMVKRV